MGQSDQQTINQMCQHALCDIITSEKFNLLCKLLVENFEGTKVDRLLDFSIINARMKEGIYERYPVLFSSDTKQVILKFRLLPSVYDILPCIVIKKLINC